MAKELKNGKDIFAIWASGLQMVSAAIQMAMYGHLLQDGVGKDYDGACFKNLMEK